MKCSAVSIRFNGAETNNYCGIAHILGILLMNSYVQHFEFDIGIINNKSLTHFLQ